MTDRIGQYELIHHVATGGMAEVWVGKHDEDPKGRSYAIKRILPHLAREDKFVEMFLDEARIASQLDHPNIVRIDELGEYDGEYFIAMEYIEGADLAEVLDLAERLEFDIPIGVAIQIAIEVLDALGYAHDFSEGEKQLNIVHRDVSPHNILVSHQGEVRLVDFGVAKAVERHSKTETGFVKGKLSYMSPEQIRQDPIVDRRSDVFAVGVVLYELLTKDTPFGRELTAVNAILTQDSPDPAKARKGIPKELSKIIRRSLEKDADDRYPSAWQMAAELKNIRDARYGGVDALSIGMMLSKLHELTMSDTLEYEAMKISMDELESIDGTTVRAPTDEIAAAIEDTPAPSRRGWMLTIATLLLVGIAGVAFAFSDDIKAAINPTKAVAKNTVEPTPDKATQVAEKATEIAVAANTAKPAEEKLPNPFEEQEDESGYFFVLEDADSEVQEGDEVVAELDDEEVQQILSFTFDRSETDQHADFLVERILASFSVVEDARLDPGDPEFDIALLDLEDQAVKKKKIRKPKKKKAVKKKPTKKKKRVVKRKKPTKKKSSKKLASKKKRPTKKIKKKNKTEVIDKAIPGGF